MKAAIGTICVVVLMSAVPVTAHAAAPQAASAQSDQSMRLAISSRINEDAALKKYDIKVSVNAGVATLTGAVATDAQSMRAAELAKAAGATRVENKIVVDANTGLKGTAGKIEDKTKAAAEKTKDTADQAWDKTKDSAAKVADKTKSGAKKAWEKTKDGWEAVVDKTAEIAKKAGAEITDAWITTSIKTRFMGEDALRDSTIDVDTDRHVVTLSGTVVSEAAHEKALDIVKDTDGVNKIVDNLTVKK